MPHPKLMEQNLVANENASIGEALKMITDNQRGAVAVVDDDFVYQGVVSDGEIRRAFVHGATQLAPISKIVNLNARTLHTDERDQANALFAKHPEITLIPIVGKRNKLIDIIIRNGTRRKA